MKNTTVKLEVNIIACTSTFIIIIKETGKEFYTRI
jgi:hypothetical protein